MGACGASAPALVVLSATWVPVSLVQVTAVRWGGCGAGIPFLGTDGGVYGVV